jgi:nicotinate-nucleotide adenylyltransferase
MARVALFGGSFNPPHVGHLLTAVAVKAVGLVDEVWMLPAKHHPFDKPLAPFHQRLRMCKTLIGDLSPDAFQVKDYEGHNPTGYSVDLLEWLQVNARPAEYSLVIGTDLVGELPKWHKPERLFELANLIVVGRSGYSKRWLKKDLPEGTRMLHHVAMPMVSSSEVRMKIGQGKDVSDLVPPKVIRLIQELGLYR